MQVRSSATCYDPLVLTSLLLYVTNLSLARTLSLVLSLLDSTVEPEGSMWHRSLYVTDRTSIRTVVVSRLRGLVRTVVTKNKNVLLA